MWTKEERDQFEARYRASELTLAEIREAAHQMTHAEQADFINQLNDVIVKYGSPADPKIKEDPAFHAAMKFAVCKILEAPCVANA